VEERCVVLMPAEAKAGAKGLHHLRDRLELRDRDLERARDEGRAAFDGEREHLLFAQAENVALRVVGHLAARGLRREPLANVARIGLGAPGERLGGERLACP